MNFQYLYREKYIHKDDNLLMSRSKGRIRQDLFSVINNTVTVKQCRMLELGYVFYIIKHATKTKKASLQSY
jgi:hypothetical protein